MRQRRCRPIKTGLAEEPFGESKNDVRRIGRAKKVTRTPGVKPGGRGVRDKNAAMEKRSAPGTKPSAEERSDLCQPAFQIGLQIDDCLKPDRNPQQAFANPARRALFRRNAAVRR